MSESIYTDFFGCACPLPPPPGPPPTDSNSISRSSFLLASCFKMVLGFLLGGGIALGGGLLGRGLVKVSENFDRTVARAEGTVQIVMERFGNQMNVGATTIGIHL